MSLKLWFPSICVSNYLNEIFAYIKNMYCLYWDFFFYFRINQMFHCVGLILSTHWKTLFIIIKAMNKTTGWLKWEYFQQVIVLIYITNQISLNISFLLRSFSYLPSTISKGLILRTCTAFSPVFSGIILLSNAIFGLSTGP